MYRFREAHLGSCWRDCIRGHSSEQGMEKEGQVTQVEE